MEETIKMMQYIIDNKKKIQPKLKELLSHKMQKIKDELLAINVGLDFSLQFEDDENYQLEVFIDYYNK